MDRDKDVVLVTGATGRQGGAVARELLKQGCRVRALTRRPQREAARALTALGAEVIQADLDDLASVRRALEGAWGVFAVQNTWEAGVAREEEQGKRLAELARKAGVRHYVYSSVASAQRRTGIPHFDNKWRIEETVRMLRFPSHVVLRPVFFMENLLSASSREGIEHGVVALAIQPETRLQMIAVADIGRYGALAFHKHEELAGRAIDIAGDTRTGPEMAEALGQVAGRAMHFVPVPIEQVRRTSEDYATMLEWFDRVGYDADIEGNAQAFGIPATSFEAWARTVRWNK
jgi:uncharacterized protein YbjT (DUF2867 family)